MDYEFEWSGVKDKLNGRGTISTLRESVLRTRNVVIIVLVANWYGTSPNSLDSKSAWQNRVQMKLVSGGYINRAFQALFGSAQ